MKFAKLEGLQNDFIVTHDPLDVARLREMAPRLCDRRRGIGADGILVLSAAPSPAAEWRMRIVNADGSEAEMCGNGIRCAALYLHRQGLIPSRALTFETLAGLRRAEINGDQVRVEMGCPVLPAGPDVTRQIDLGDRTLTGTPVSMGNPHFVVHTPALSDDLLLEDGPRLSAHPCFPQQTNVEFVRVLSPREIELRVYERGCGETPACGTGACASVVAGVLHARHDQTVTVHMPGGDLLVEWDGHPDHPVFMTGPARWVFAGEIEAVDGL